MTLRICAASRVAIQISTAISHIEEGVTCFKRTSFCDRGDQSEWIDFLVGFQRRRHFQP